MNDRAITDVIVSTAVPERQRHSRLMRHRALNFVKEVGRAGWHKPVCREDERGVDRQRDRRFEPESVFSFPLELIESVASATASCITVTRTVHDHVCVTMWTSPVFPVSGVPDESTHVGARAIVNES